MILPVILLVLSFATRFIFFGYPAEVVFDEVHNGGYVNNYISGEYYFDVHPPLAKIISTFFAQILGFSGGVDFGNIGNDLPWIIVLLRLIPMIAGTLLPLLIYFICRHLSLSKIASFSAGLLVVLENSLLVQSRFILFDAIMLAFGFASILLYLIYIKRGKKLPLILSAVFAASAFSIKWTGLAFPLIILIYELIRTKKLRPTLKIFFLYALAGTVIYLSVFAVHFSLLKRSGPGDAFMTDRFQKTLEGNVHAGDPIEPKKFFGKTIELNIKMLEANQNLTKAHDYSSKWFTWPFMIRPIFYWQGEKVDNVSQYIYLIGNPFIYWLGSISILLLLIRLIKKKYDDISLFVLSGFLVNFLPFIFIGRVMFIYHYEAALIFSIVAICYAIEKGVSEKFMLHAFIVLVVFCSAAFLYFSPLTYGLDLSDEALKARIWFPSWR